MKKHILSFAIIATMISTIAAGCSSRKNRESVSDTIIKDTSKMNTPVSAPAPDTIKKDTMKKDTVHH